MVQVQVLVQGFPGRAVCHGGLGWATLTLLRGHGRIVLIDVGAFGLRRPLHRALTAQGIAPDEVTDVVLTHAHYDHAVNFTLFPKATIWIGARELEWAAAQPPGFDPLPELYVQELARSPRVKRVLGGDTFLPGLQAIDAPGHTPGHLLFLLRDQERQVLFTGDAAKNRAELLSGDVDLTEDRALSQSSIARIWAIWRSAPDMLLVPGHDLSMVLDDHGQIQYQGEREAAISAWFSESIHDSTIISLDNPQPWGHPYREQQT